MSTTEAKVVLSVVDRITAPLAAIQRRIDRLTAPVRRITRALGDVGRAAGLDRISNAVGRIGSRISAASAHASTFFARLSAISGISLAGVGLGLKDLWKVNSNMETMRMRIGELFGKDRKKEVMDWAVAFDRVNPGGIEDIVNNLARLKAFGIDGTLGPLKALVDYNSKIGGGQEKLSRIILAIGQMQSKNKIQGGEVLQLTEAGVPAMQLLQRATGKTTKALEDMQRKGKLGPEYIRKLVTQMGKESDGAGAAYMATAEGIIDKFQSTVQGFKLKVGDFGAFDFMKQKLDQFADWVNALDSDAVAKRISDGIVSAGKEIEAAIRRIDIKSAMDQFERGWQIAKQLGTALQWLSEKVGGPVNLVLGTLAAFTLAPLAASVLSAVAAIAQLSVVLLTTPVGVFLLAVAAIAGAAALIYQNWEPIKKLFDDIWTKFTATAEFKAFESVNTTFYDFGTQMIESLWEGIQSRFPMLVAGIRQQLATMTSWMPDWLKDKLGIADIGRAAPSGGATGEWGPAGASGSWTNPSGGDWGGRAWAPPMPGRSVAPASTASASANGRVAGAFEGAASGGGVPSLTQQTNLDVNAPSTMQANFTWQAADSILAQVRAQLQAFRAESDAKIRAALSSALSD